MRKRRFCMMERRGAMKTLRLVLLLAAVSTAAALTPFAAAQGAPAVTGVEVTSDAGADATYALGETVEVTVTFSEAVAVTGAPGLSIDMDPASWGEKRAAYARGSGTAALVFTHKVVRPNYSTLGVAVLGNTLALDGGSIRSASSGANAALAHTGLPHNAAHKVDWRLSPRDAAPRLVRNAATAPAVTKVEVTSAAGADATYALGETIEVTVTFSEAVDVTGAPGLAIDMDPASWGRKRAVYARGSGTAALVFAHTVVQPNLSTRGIAVLGSTLSLNGGAIRSASSGAEAALAHVGLPHNAAHKVDWRLSRGATVRRNATPDDTTPPELVSGEVDGSTLRLTFSEALDPDATGGRFSVSLSTEPLSSAFHATGAVTVEGAVVTVELGEGNVQAQAGRLTGNRVTYIRRADGGGGALRDLAGNPVAAAHVMPYGGVETWRGSEEWRYVGIALDNVTAPPADTTPPELVRGEIDGGTVTLWFSEELDPTATAGRFHVQVQPSANLMQSFDAAGAVAIDGNRVTVDVGEGKPRARAGLMELNYAHYIAPLDPAARGLRDLAGNPVAAPLAFYGGERGTRAVKLDNVTVAAPDTTPPRLSRTVVNGAKLTLAFNEAIDAAASLANGAFAVKKTPPGGTEETVGLSGTPAVEGARVTLTLAKAVRGADTGVKVSYRKPDSDARNRLRDKAGNEVAEFSDKPVTNVAGDTTPPELVRGEIDSGTVTLYFSEPLDPDSVGGKFGVWVVHSNGNRYWTYAEGDVEISGNAVTVGLLSPIDDWGLRAKAGVQSNQAYYRRSTDPTAKSLRDLAGNPVKTPHAAYDGTFSHTRIIFLDNVTGLASTSPSVTGVAVTSDAGDDGTYALGEVIRVRLTFSDEVAVTGAPRVQIDLSSGAGDEKWAAYASGSGTETLEFAYTVAEGDESSAGVAVLRDTLALNGGTIQSSSVAGESANLAHVKLDHDPSHKVDGVTPTLSAATVDRSTLTLTFSETLGAASPANDAFTVKKTPHGGTEEAVSLSGTPAISGATVTLTLANAVLSADTDIKVSYAKPTSDAGNRLRDAAGNEVASFTGQSVTNGTGKPAVTGVAVSSDAGDDDTYALGEVIRVRLTFSDEVDVTGAPRVQIDFSSGAGDERWADYASGSGTKMLEFAYTVAANDLSTDGVAVPANTLALNGGAIESASVAGKSANLAHVKLDHDPNHKVDAKPPTLSAAAVDRSTLTLTFNETLGAAASLANGAFTVKKTPQGGTAQNVSLSGTPAISGAKVTLTLLNPVLATDTDVKVSYTRPTSDAGNRLKDAVGNEVASFTDKRVTNVSGSPRVESAEVGGTELIITFDKPLFSSAWHLSNDAFTVKKTPQGGDEETVRMSEWYPQISGRTVILRLPNPLLATDTDVKVSYTRPSSNVGNRLRDAAGNEVASFTDQPVSINTTQPWLERGEIDGGTMTFFFSEPLDPDSVGGRFRLTMTHTNGRTYSFSAAGDVEISGNAVKVGLQYRARAGDKYNTAFYIRPTNPAVRGLRDLDGNEVKTPYDGNRETKIVFLNNLTGVALSVADAQANEGAGATVSFVVTLSRAAAGTVTVDYATADGTATAGSDYTATSGTLTFAAGETTKTVSVSILDDSHDEGEETFTLSLSNAQGGWITDGEAIGTIANSDAMPRAWLARFGRTVADHVIGAVSARVDGGAAPTRVTLGGQEVLLGDAARVALGGGRDGLGKRGGDAPHPEVRETSMRELLLASSFHLASAEGETEGPRWSLWGRGARTNFDGREGALTLTGDVTTGLVGADYESGRVLVGVALALSSGDGSYEESGMRGEVESSLAGVYPYLRYAVSERLAVWGAAGLGEGDLTLKPAGAASVETDLSMSMAAVGARGALLTLGGFDLTIRSDLAFVRTESEAAAGLAAAEADTSRLRLALEGSAGEMGFAGGALTPTVELGLRLDGGDAETGAGVEVGGGLRYASGRLAVEFSARGLLAHEEDEYEEWGVSASVRFSPNEGGRGLSLRAASTWGAAAGGVDRLWSQRAAGDLARGAFDPGEAGVDAEVGYGFDFRRGLLTPYTGVALSQNAETWRAGARWKIGPAFDVSLEASLTDPANGEDTESGVLLRGSRRW